MLPSDRSRCLGPLAACLEQERADAAQVRLTATVAARQLRRRVLIRLFGCVRTTGVLVVMAMAMRVATAVVGVLAAMARAADLQPVMGAVVRHQRVQAVAQQRDAAVEGRQRERQNGAGRGDHGGGIPKDVSGRPATKDSLLYAYYAPETRVVRQHGNVNAHRLSRRASRRCETASAAAPLCYRRCIRGYPPRHSVRPRG
jgi:hypothetical protein